MRQKMDYADLARALSPAPRSLMGMAGAGAQMPRGGGSWQPGMPRDPSSMNMPRPPMPQQMPRGGGSWQPGMPRDPSSVNMPRPPAPAMAQTGGTFIKPGGMPQQMPQQMPMPNRNRRLGR